MIPMNHMIIRIERSSTVSGYPHYIGGYQVSYVEHHCIREHAMRLMPALNKIYEWGAFPMIVADVQEGDWTALVFVEKPSGNGYGTIGDLSPKASEEEIELARNILKKHIAEGMA